MIGAVLGDMAGTPLEDGSYKTRDDDLFPEDYSDVSLDSVMAVAVAETLLNKKVHAASWEIRSAVFGSCEKWWKGYAASGDKAVFFTWLIDDDTAVDRAGCVSWMSTGSAGFMRQGSAVVLITAKRSDGILPLPGRGM